MFRFQPFQYQFPFYGQALNIPMNQPMSQTMGQGVPMNQQVGQPMLQPMPQQMSQTMGQGLLMNQQMAQPMQQPVSHQMSQQMGMNPWFMPQGMMAQQQPAQQTIGQTIPQVMTQQECVTRKAVEYSSSDLEEKQQDFVKSIDYNYFNVLFCILTNLYFIKKKKNAT